MGFLPPQMRGQSGFSLMETMVALGISGVVFSSVGVVIIGAEKHRAWATQQAERETMREMMRNRLACELPCAEQLPRLQGRFGRYQVGSNCRGPMANELELYVVDTTTKTVEPLLDIGDGYPCRERRAVACGEYCDTQTTFLERGFLSPPLDAMPRQTAGCPEGAQIIGIDFSTGRLICEVRDYKRPEGVYCKSDWNDQRVDSAGREVVITGKEPCTQFTQYTGRKIGLKGARLKITLAAGFVPSEKDRFVVVYAQLIKGRLASETGGRINLVGSQGSFAVEYYPTAVVLTKFQRDPGVAVAAAMEPVVLPEPKAPAKPKVATPKVATH